MSRRKGKVAQAAAGVVSDAGGRLAAYLPPWLLWLVLPVFAMMLRGLGNNSTSAGIAVGVIVTVLVIGAVAFTWRVFGPRGQDVRAHAAAFAALAGLFVVIGAAAGMWSTPDVRVTLRHPGTIGEWFAGVWNWPWAVWFFGMLAAAGSWNVRRIARGDGTDAHPDQAAGFLSKVGLAARSRGPAQLEGGGTRVRLPLATVEGTAEDIVKAAPEMAARAGIRREGVRVEIDPDNHANGDVVFTPRDLLRATRAWPGPRHPGESIGLEIVTSIAEDGEPGRLWLPGDPKVGRNASHLRVGGMSGAGKTEWALTLYGEVLPRRDVSVVWMDYVKGLQSCADVAQGMAMTCTDKATAHKAYRRLPHVIRARTKKLGEHGFKQWTPEAGEVTGLRLLVVHIEEAADMLAGSQLIAALAEQARSAGVILALSAQRWTHDRIPVSARANFAACITFGIQSEEEAEYAMHELAVAGGASPWVWLNERPGYHYPQVPGVDRKRWTMPHRAELAEPGHLREVVREWCPIERTQLDAVTAVAFGDVYAAHRQDVLNGRAEWQQLAAEPFRAAGVDVPRPQTTPAPPADEEEAPMQRDEPVDDGGLSAGAELDGGPMPAEPALPFTGAGGQDDVDDVDEDDDPDGDDVDDVDGEFERREQPEPGFMDDADPSTSLKSEEATALPFGEPAPPAREIGATEARQRLKDELRRLADGGRETIRPADLVEFRKSLPRSAGWLTTELQRLERAGELRAHPDHGVYALRVPVPA